MRKLFAVLGLLIAINTTAQVGSIRDSATLRYTINNQITTNGTRAITGAQLNAILNGYLNIWPRVSNGFTNLSGTSYLGGNLNRNTNFNGAGLYNFTIDNASAIALSTPNFQLNLGADAAGDMYYRSGAGIFQRIPLGPNGTVLMSSGGVPSFQTLATGGTGSTYSDAQARAAVTSILGYELAYTDSIRIRNVPASKVITDPSRLFTTQAQQTAWNNKLNAADTLNRWQPKGTYLTPADTLALRRDIQNIIYNGTGGGTGGSGTTLTFSNGLERVSNDVRARYFDPIWHTNRIQGFYVDATRPRNGYFLGFDSTNGVIRWMPSAGAGSGGGPEVDPIYSGSAAAGVTLTDINRWNTAWTNWHTHPNLDLLNSVDATDTTRWGAAGVAAETDPFRVTGVTVTGDATKTVTLTLANGATVAGSFTDNTGAAGTTDGNNYVDGFSVSGNTFTINRVGLAPLTATYTPPAETDPVFNASVAKNITAADITNWNNDVDTDAQTLSISGNTLSILRGNSVTLPATGITSETDPVFSASPASGITSANITAFTGAANDRVTAIGVAGTTTKTITLTQADGGTLTASFTDVDTDTNTDAQTLSVSGNNLTISGGNTVALPTFTDTDNFVDALTFNTGTRVLTVGRTGALADFTVTIPDANTDAQTLSIAGQTLSISGGNSVTIPSGITSESDPKRVTAAAFTGTATKTLTLTLADASTITASFNDNEGAAGTTDGNNYVDAFTVSGNTFTINRVGLTPLTATYTPPTFTETDPIFGASAAKNITAGNITDWNSKQAGDADLTSIAGLTGTSGRLIKTAANTWALDNTTFLTAESDPKRLTGLAVTGTGTKTVTATLADATTVTTTFTDVDTDTDAQTLSLSGNTLSIVRGNSVTLPTFTDTDNFVDALAFDNATRVLTVGRTGALADFTVTIPDATGITSETDPVFGASAAKNITSGNITDWNSKQAGDADLTSIAGLTGTTGLLRKTAANTWSLDNTTYLSSFTEVDPKRVTGVAFSGTGTKTLTVTFADATTTTGTFTDLNTDAQTLSISGQTLTIAGGNSVTLPASPTPTLALVTGAGNTTGAVVRSSASFATSSTDFLTDYSLLTAITTGTGQTGGMLVLKDNLSANTSSLRTTGLTGAHTQYLPNKSGTIALTSDVVADTDAQTLSLSGNTLSIVRGNSVTLPTYLTAETDPKRLTTLAVTGTSTKTVTATLADATTVTTTFTDLNTPDTDAQTLSISGNTLSIVRGNSITLPTYPTTLGALTDVTITTPAANQVLSHNGTNWINRASSQIDMTGFVNGDLVQYNGTDFVRYAGTNLTASVNDRVTNVAVTGTTTKTVTLTQADGGTLTASFSDLNTDAQTLSISGSTLSISGGNSITLPASGGGGGDAYLANNQTFTGLNRFNKPVGIGITPIEDTWSGDLQVYRQLGDPATTGGAAIDIVTGVNTTSKYGYAALQFALRNPAAVGGETRLLYNFGAEGNYSNAGVATNYNFNIYDVVNQRHVMKITGANATPQFVGLAGSGTRMVVADASGNMTTQAIPTGSGTYTLPAATASVLGGIKVGTGLAVTADGTLSATGGGGSADGNGIYTGSGTIPAFTTATLGGSQDFTIAGTSSYLDMSSTVISIGSTAGTSNAYVDARADRVDISASIGRVLLDANGITFDGPMYNNDLVTPAALMAESSIALDLVVNSSGDIGTATKVRRAEVTYVNDNQSLFGKRIVGRMATSTTGGTVTPNKDTHDEFNYVNLAANITIANPTNTLLPSSMERILFRIRDNGTAKTISWGTMYRAGSDIALPTTTVANKDMYVGFVWNSSYSKWDLVTVLNGY